jgi:hypothetical protein
MLEPRWRELARKGENRGRVVDAFLRHYMAQAGIDTFKTLADCMDLNAATISWWKTTNHQTRTIPENKHIAKLAELLHCTQDDVREAFGLRETPPLPDAMTREIVSIVGRLSPSDQAWILEIAMARLSRQSQHENHHEHTLEPA